MTPEVGSTVRFMIEALVGAEPISGRQTETAGTPREVDGLIDSSRTL